MKIFNVEDGRKKAYIQVKDIKFIELMKKDEFGITEFVKGLDDELFIEFTEEKYIDFINQQTYIPSYKIIKTLTPEELDFVIQVKTEEFKKIHDEYNSMEKGKQPESLLYKGMALEYEIESMKIYKYSLGSNSNLPLVIDSNQLLITGTKNNQQQLIVGYSLDGNRILLKPAQKEPLDANKNDIQKLLFEAAAALAYQTENTQLISGPINIDYELTENSPYIVSEDLSKRPEAEQDFQEKIDEILKNSENEEPEEKPVVSEKWTLKKVFRYIKTALKENTEWF